MEREYGRSRKNIKKNNISDKIFIRTFRRTIVSIVLCTVCLISSTWAWFVASAESQLPVITFGDLNTTVLNASSTWSRFSHSVFRPNRDGKYELKAGEYQIAVEPLYGSAPVYCLIDIEAESVSKEKIEEAIDLFNEDMEEKWIPMRASDSNGIMVLKNEEELEAYQIEIAEENEEFEYEILPFSVVNEGIYRVDWEPEEERSFMLTLEADAVVSFKTFWLTDDAEEEEYLDLDELTGWNYVLIYPKKTATSTNTAKQTTKPASETKVNSSQAANELKTETTSESEESDLDVADKKEPDVKSESGSKESESATTESKGAKDTSKESVTDTESESEAKEESGSADESSEEEDSEEEKESEEEETEEEGTEDEDTESDTLKTVVEDEETETSEIETEVIDLEASTEDSGSSGAENTL